MTSPELLVQAGKKTNFTAGNGGPTRLEDCFLSPFVHRRTETAHPVPTKVFSKLDIGFGLTKELVGIVIRDYLKYQPAHPNPFHLGIPE